jgi:hypothetical protein
LAPFAAIDQAAVAALIGTVAAVVGGLATAAAKI